jgi:hypothetical protein
VILAGNADAQVESIFIDKGGKLDYKTTLIQGAA